MPTFTDTKSRTWTVAVDVNALRRVRDALQLNLADGVDLKKIASEDTPLLERLAGDPPLLVDVIYLLVKPQCDETKVTDEEFGRSFDGPVLQAAAVALTESLCDFFPTPVTQVIRRTMTRAKARATTANVTDENLNALVDRALDAAAKSLASRIGNSSSSSRGSLASNRARSRRGS